MIVGGDDPIVDLIEYQAGRTLIPFACMDRNGHADQFYLEG
jgi:hypothetical protein